MLRIQYSYSIIYLHFRNHYFVPKHNRGLKTIRLVRLMNGSFNPGPFIKDLIPKLGISIDIRIKVGFSLIGVKFEKMEQEFTYFYAAEELAAFKGVFRKHEEAVAFAESLEKRQYHDFMNETFLESESGDAFANSGFGPHYLVACYIWLSK